MGEAEQAPSASAGRERLFERLDAYFDITARGSDFRTEILAGISTFLALAYIVVVNPAILSEAGFDWRAVFFATVIVSGGATLLMGLSARLPFAVAPGMEMNAYVAYFAIGTLGLTWAEGLGAVFWSGVAFLIASATGARLRVINSIPDNMKVALSLSVGVFIAMIAFKISGVLRFEGLRVVGLGDVTSVAAMALALSAIGGLLLRRVPGGMLIAILLSTGLLHVTGSGTPTAAPMPPDGDMFAHLASLDLGVLLDPRAWAVIFVLFLVDFYGSVAKLVGLGRGTSLARPEGVPRMRRALLVDSGATIVGAGLGTTNATVYVESGVGIAAGGRTGLTAVVCGVALLSMLLLAPALQHLPVAATTGALLVVAFTLVPGRADLRGMDAIDILALVGMQAAVLGTAAIDVAFLVGASVYTLRSIVRRERPNIFLAGSVVALSAGYLSSALS